MLVELGEIHSLVLRLRIHIESESIVDISHTLRELHLKVPKLVRATKHFVLSPTYVYQPMLYVCMNRLGESIRHVVDKLSTLYNVRDIQQILKLEELGDVVISTASDFTLRHQTVRE